MAYRQQNGDDPLARLDQKTEAGRGAVFLALAEPREKAAPEAERTAGKVALQTKRDRGEIRFRDLPAYGGLWR